MTADIRIGDHYYFVGSPPGAIKNGLNGEPVSWLSIHERITVGGAGVLNGEGQPHQDDGSNLRHVFNDLEKDKHWIEVPDPLFR